MARLERSSADGETGHGVSTTPATASPAWRAASTVRSVCEIVPRPGRAATTSGKPSMSARSRTVWPTVSGTSSPPTPSITSTSARASAAAALAATTIASRSSSTPASSAARCGATAGPNVCGVTARTRVPAAAASSS